MIHFSQVNKWYAGGYHALRDVDFKVRRGETVVVCGPSGSGKSTLIRCINGIEAFDSGRLVVADQPLDGSRAALAQVRRRVGMVFQQFNLFPHLTVMDNVTLGPRLVGKMQLDEAERLARECLEGVHMAAHAHRYPAQLSGGQQQRVAIARALCMRPEILLFDEPTSALDPEMVNEVLEVMFDLARGGTTMVCVTHELNFGRAVADRMVFMDAGAIVEQGPPATFFTAPCHARTRSFLSKILGTEGPAESNELRAARNA